MLEQGRARAPGRDRLLILQPPGYFLHWPGTRSHPTRDKAILEPCITHPMGRGIVYFQNTNDPLHTFLPKLAETMHDWQTRTSPGGRNLHQAETPTP